MSYPIRNYGDVEERCDDGSLISKGEYDFNRIIAVIVGYLLIAFIGFILFDIKLPPFWWFI